METTSTVATTENITAVLDILLRHELGNWGSKRLWVFHKSKQPLGYKGKYHFCLCDSRIHSLNT